MSKDKINFLKRSVAIIDILLTINAFSLSFILRNYFFSTYGKLNDFNEYLWLLVIVIPAWLVTLYSFKCYRFVVKENIIISIFKVFAASLMGIVIVVAALFFIKADYYSRPFFVIFVGCNCILLGLSRIFIKIALNLYLKHSKNLKKVLVIGTNDLANKFTDFINDNDGLMIDIVGFINEEQSIDSNANNLNILGDLSDLDNILKHNVVDEVVFALPKDSIIDIEFYALKCESMGITVHMIIDLLTLEFSKPNISNLGPFPMISYHTVSNDQLQLLAKRVLDFIGGLVGVVFFVIALIFVGPAIYLESPGPILFCQKRVGKNGRIFNCYKFRSMYADAEKRKKELLKQNEMNGAMFKIKNDPRITKVGKIIRAASIDELPQFLNVIKGDMSLVGTRPPTLDEVKKYDDYHWRRLSVKPGITGLWQVSGRNDISDFEDVVKLDTEYIDNWSFWQDIKLLFKTVYVVFARAGAS